jgi:outer membrane protein OmpA-like peptidoglycan-associated protein
MKHGLIRKLAVGSTQVAGDPGSQLPTANCALPTADRPHIRITLAALLIGLVSLVHAQPGGYTSTHKGAVKRYEAGVQCMRGRQWDCAESEFSKAAAADPRFVEPRLMLAEIMAGKRNDAEAIRYYREVMDLAPRFHPSAQLHLADLEFRSGQYDAAEANYRNYLAVEVDPQRKARARLGLDNCAFARHAMQQPVPFEPVNLGPGVNTAAPEYYPCITADDRTLVFTRRIPSDDPLTGEQEDFFMSRRTDDGTWGPSREIFSVNTAHNEGAGTLSPDGRFIIFTACAHPDGSYGKARRGLGSCDLFISRRIGERWSPPENLGPPVNSRNWESQPSLASDGRTLYFVRGIQARDGVRNTDIMVTTLQDDGTWSPPEKLGPHVNTPHQEESVQIHPDGRTLYFSSNGHPGMGGLDIYVSRRQDDGTWGPALNLGWPINTGGDENSLLVSADGRVAYFASDRPGGHGELDLYGFELYPEARPQPVSYVQGRVYDADTRAPIEADVMLYDLETGALATAAYSDPATGEFLVCIPTGRTYALNAGAEGYLFFSRNYDVRGTGGAGDPFTLDVPMSPLKAGASIALRNVFFPTASHELLPASEVELDKLVRLLFLNPALRIELGGHTDNVGNDAANQQLSEQRAHAVRDHLIGRGVDAARVTARGYGEARPVATNDTEEGRALNRRTEVTVL